MSLPVVKHSLRDFVKSPIPGGKSPDEYFKTRKTIADGLTKENLQSIQFLCGRYIPRSCELTSGLKLLEYIEEFIDENDVTFLVEILFLIQRYDLIKAVPGLCNRSDLEKNWSGLCIFKDQEYRNFAVQLETRLAEDDWRLFKLRCKELANYPKLDRAGTVIDILQKLEELDLVCDDDFSALLMILDQLKAKDPYWKLKNIQDIKNTNGVQCIIGNCAAGAESENEKHTSTLSKKTFKTKYEKSEKLTNNTPNGTELCHFDPHSVSHSSEQDLRSTSELEEEVIDKEFKNEEEQRQCEPPAIISEGGSVENLKVDQNISVRNVILKEVKNGIVMDQLPHRGKIHEKSEEESQVKQCLEKTMENEDKGASKSGEVAESKSCTTLAVIINNKDFVQFGCVEYALRKAHGMPLPHFGITNRDWSDIDVDEMSYTLKRLGVDTCVYENLSSSSILDTLREIAQGSVKRGKHKKLEVYDRFLLFILSHGDSGHVYGVEGFTVSLSEVLEIFNADNCRTLANKLKIVFPVWCRTSTLTPEADIEYVGLKNRIEQETNLLVIYPTQYGCPSYRVKERGTVFVSEFFGALNEHRQERNLMEIFEMVRKRLSQYKECSQLPECSGHLQEEFYF